MKKLCVLFAFLLLLTPVFAGCSEKNDVELDPQAIENRTRYNKLTNAINEIYFQDLFADDYEEHYQEALLPETEKEIKETLTEDTVIVQTCEEKGVLKDKATARQYAQTEYGYRCQEDAGGMFAAALENALTQFGLAENDYLDLLYEEAYYKYNRQSLKDYFYKNEFDEKSGKTPDEQFEAYIKTLFK